MCIIIIVPILFALLILLPDEGDSCASLFVFFLFMLIFWVWEANRMVKINLGHVKCLRREMRKTIFVYVWRFSHFKRINCDMKRLQVAFLQEWIKSFTVSFFLPFFVFIRMTTMTTMFICRPNKLPFIVRQCGLGFLSKAEINKQS